MRSALIWDITQRMLLIPYRRFGTTYPSSSVVELRSQANVGWAKMVVVNTFSEFGSFSGLKYGQVLIGGLNSFNPLPPNDL
jgi:hypothetical protein